MFGNVYGLDLGTYEIKVFDKKQGKIRREKDVIAIKNKRHIFAIGDKAYDMYEKSPEDIEVVFPMKSGVIARFDNMQTLLGALLKSDRRSIWGAEYVVAVPTDVTEVEKKAFCDLALHSEAKAKSVRIVERGLADAVGLGIDIFKEKGIFIANFGGGITELSVLSSGGLVLNRLLKIGGDDFDAAITGLVRHNKEFLIGKTTAEMLRKKFGVFEQSTNSTITVSGRDLVTGVPSQTDVSIGIVRAAIKEPLDECVRSIKLMLDRTPPDVRRAINERGIYLTGGLTNLKGLSTYIRERVGLPVTTVDEPELCAVKGLQKIILDKEYYKKLTYSMLDEDYRWLR
ncbi:rod shape-determining protein [Mediterraneibacter sp.]|uniref:rod shape-determining protein n=1 Tax=Mediterraneibacter sp. TaxID=2316022 RepID=UPI0027B96792|nr:rod shape-determining protein [Mediterraneibacter sp.]